MNLGLDRIIVKLQAVIVSQQTSIPQEEKEEERYKNIKWVAYLTAACWR